MGLENNNIIKEFEEIVKDANNSGNLSEVGKETNNILKSNKPGRVAGREKTYFEKKNPGGRPKGSVSKQTMDEKMAAEYIRTRVKNSLSKLIDSQMNLARGCQYLFKIKKQYDDKKDRWFIPKFSKPEIVKDKEEMARYLAGEFDGKEECDYYFITSEKPDNKALDSLLDRTLGKATQKIEGNLGVSISDLLNELK